MIVEDMRYVSRFVSTKGTIWSLFLVPCVARFCFYCTERRTLGITRSLGRSRWWRVVTAVVLSSPYSHHLKRFRNSSGVLLWLCWCSTMCWVSWVLLRPQFSHESYVVTIIANHKYSRASLASELQVCSRWDHEKAPRRVRWKPTPTPSLQILI